MHVGDLLERENDYGHCRRLRGERLREPWGLVRKRSQWDQAYRRMRHTAGKINS
jgi:hypothetical protein